MLICHSCKKKYRSNILACPKCGRELLPPSAIKFRTEHPDLSQPKRPPKPAPSKKTPAVEQAATYIDILRGSLNEMKEAARFLEREGIQCRIDRDEVFQFQYRLGGENQAADQEGAAVRVPISQFEKARALLEWEVQKKNLNKTEDSFLSQDEEGTVVCPACDSVISSDEEICPECGRELDLDGETDEEEYFCSSCGESCDPDDPVCPNCGAHFDH